MMERWGNRYAHDRNDGRGVEHSRADRVKSIAIILLLVAILGVGIAGGQAIAFRGRTEQLLISRALTECSAAVNQGTSLSRSGGSDTAGVLGKIRASINAVDVLSGIRQTLYGQPLAPKADFTSLYEIIDSYSAKLRNGTSTIDELTRLNEGLAALQIVLQNAK